MKSKTLLTLSLIFVCVACVIFAFCLPINNIVRADTIVEKQDIVPTLALNQYLSDTPIDKTSTSAGEEKTAKEYLSTFMQTMGLEKYNNAENYWHQFTFGINKTSYNVIGVKKSAEQTNNTIVLGAHFDNTNKQTSSTGALDNGTGVVLLMSIIKTIISVEYDYNLIFCFFGASQSGYAGSESFYASLNNETKKNLLLYINFDKIGGGEYTYYYAGENSNTYTSLFNLSQNQISAMPSYSKINYVFNNKRMAYSHAGLQSDNVTFYKNGINCINFFSGNLNGLNSGYKESANHQNIGNTKNDTIDILQKYYPNYTKHLNNVALSVVQALNNTNLTQNLQQDKSSINFNFLNKKLIIFFVGIIGVLLLGGIRIKKEIKNA